MKKEKIDMSNLEKGYPSKERPWLKYYSEDA